MIILIEYDNVWLQVAKDLIQVAKDLILKLV